jgi:predicted O-linked N-acetylglucosamine transferase (SPINDLY family)
VLALEPDHRAALSLLGKLELKAGRLEQAATWLERAVELGASSVDLSNLGVVYFRQRLLERAVETLARALEIDANNVDAVWNLGLVLLERGELEQGLTFLTRAAGLRPESLAFQLRLANVLLAAGRFEQAVQHFRQALSLEPSNVALSYRVLATLVQSDRLVEAEELSRWLVEAQPGRADRYVALGRVLSKQRKFSQAIVAFRQALALEPQSTAVTTPLVEALASLGRVDETITELERAIAVDPTLAAEHSTLVFQTAFSSRYGAEAQLAAARRWSDLHAAPLIGRRRAHPHDRSPERRLRIGYVSPDFRKHVQRLFTIPVLSRHDHAGYEVVCYSSVKAPDEYTQRIKGLSDEWHDVARLGDRELAQKIRDDRIDVLVDLSMHMAKNRLEVFAEKPSPVQLSWLAYPGTTGVDGMDYRITDPFLDPPGAPLPYSEESLWLPQTFWCYEPDGDEIEVGELPQRRSGHITFGCLNNFMKVSRATLELWARVLRANDGSKLLMLAPRDWAQDEVRNTLGQNGVDSARIEFVDIQSRERYLETYNRIDIALDTLPYQGHTTSLDAYWMGVPVVTLVGETVVGRAGLSLASNLELPDWVARDAAQFVRIASRFARDPSSLSALRSELRQRLRRSPLMDAVRFTRDLEAAYRDAWRRFCAAPHAD